MFPVVKNPVHGHLYACHQRLPSYYTDSHITQTVIGHSGLHFPCSISLITHTIKISLKQTFNAKYCLVFIALLVIATLLNQVCPDLAPYRVISCLVLCLISCVKTLACVSRFCVSLPTLDLACSGLPLSSHPVWIQFAPRPDKSLFCWISYLPRPLVYVCPRRTQPCLWITLRLASAISVC